MTTLFTANHITVTNEEECLIIGFADMQFQTHNYVMLQRSHEFNEQDYDLGMDDIYIERGPGGQAVYGGIQRIVLQKEQVTLFLSDEAAQSLACNNEIRIFFGSQIQIPPEFILGLTEMCKEKIMLHVE